MEDKFERNESKNFKARVTAKIGRWWPFLENRIAGPELKRLPAKRATLLLPPSYGVQGSISSPLRFRLRHPCLGGGIRGAFLRPTIQLNSYYHYVLRYIRITEYKDPPLLLLHPPAAKPAKSGAREREKKTDLVDKPRPLGRPFPVIWGPAISPPPNQSCIFSFQSKRPRGRGSRLFGRDGRACQDVQHLFFFFLLPLLSDFLSDTLRM